MRFSGQIYRPGAEARRLSRGPLKGAGKAGFTSASSSSRGGICQKWPGSRNIHSECRYRKLKTKRMMIKDRESSQKTTGTRGLVVDIDHFAVHDGPGIRTAVYLKGCPLHCIWCHSPETQSFHPELLYLPQKCTACGLCLAACEQGALSIDQAKLPGGGRLGKMHPLRRTAPRSATRAR